MSKETSETPPQRAVPVEPTRIVPTPPPTRYIMDSVETNYDKYREKSSLNQKKK